MLLAWWWMMLYLVGLKAHAGSVSAEHDVMFTVEPQQTVVCGSHQLLGSPGDFITMQWWPTAHPVHAVYQNLSSICEVLHSVYTYTGLFYYCAQNQPLVGHHLGDSTFISRDNRQDVRNEVSHTVVTQVDPKMCEESSGNLQQIPTFKDGDVIGLCFQLLFVLTWDQSCEKAVEELQEKHGLRSEILKGLGRFYPPSGGGRGGGGVQGLQSWTCSHADLLRRMSHDQ